MEKKRSEVNKLKEYESIISSQKEHINRYESRLKDIIVAYKGLAKEKKALEQSLQALNVGNHSKDDVPVEVNETKATGSADVIAPGDEHVQKLMKNIATISAERNRIEEVMKHERNQLRQELSAKDVVIDELTNRLKDLENKSNQRLASRTCENSAICNHAVNDTTYKDQALTIRELKKLLDDERNLNERLEMQLGNLKTQFLLMPTPESKKRSDPAYASPENGLPSAENSPANLKLSLQDLHTEMAQMKKQYASILAGEKQRVLLAEENSKRLGEIHEERVASFESRIRDMSEMIGKYDRLREQDKETVLHLQRTIAAMRMKTDEESSVLVQTNLDCESIEDGYGVHEKFDNHTKESNASCVFSISSDGIPHDHADMLNELENYRWRYEQSMSENQKLQKELLLNTECIARLKHKLDEQKQSTIQLEAELQGKLADQQVALKNEVTKHTELLSALQVSFESQIGHLQDSLQKQRERSLAVMDEKDEEIKTLRTSLEILSLSTATIRQQESANGSSTESRIDHRSVDQVHGLNMNTGVASVTLTSSASMADEQQHLLHYAQEIARKNVEISGLRASKHASDVSLRKVLQDKVLMEENFKEQESQMEREIERLRRNRQLEGSNLEYLKNVVISFLLTRDIEGRKHMVNAIAAVLKFDQNEIEAVNRVKF